MPPVSLSTADAAAGPAPAGTALAASPLRFSGPRPTAAQQRFNRLLDRSDLLAERIAAVHTLGDQIHQQDARQLEPLRTQRDALLRQMALHLDLRLGQPGLARSQQQQARELLCGIAAGLAERGDEAMRALHDAHSETPWASRQGTGAASAEAEDGEAVAPAAGTPPEYTDGDGGEEADAEEDFGTQQAREAAQREAARAAHQARRQQAREKKQQAKQGRGRPTAALDPDSALRTLYRQLARHLHPDLEPDAAARARKTALMGQANTAYAQRDLPTLLRLQHAASTAADNPPVLAEERLDALNHLLQERVERLNGELQALEHGLRQSFGLHPRDPVNEAALRRYLGYDKADLAEDIQQLQGELRALGDEQFFQRWLRTQHKLWQREG